MGFAICENLKGFTTTRPPMVLFMTCLGAFAVVLMTLAYIVKVKDQIANPDLTQDWNNFFGNFADMEFCVLGNATESDIEPQPSQRLTQTLSKVKQKLLGPTVDLLDEKGEDIVNTSVTMLVEMTPTRDFVNIPHNVTYLSTTLSGEQLGLIGNAAAMLMNVTLSLPFEWNTTKCHEASDHCRKVQILTCINFKAPASFFPSVRQSGSCYSTISQNESSMEYHSRMIGYPKNNLPADWSGCQKKPKLNVQYRLHPALTMMLTLKQLNLTLSILNDNKGRSILKNSLVHEIQHLKVLKEDRSVINLHLMHTSYFLFIMFITIFCYALIRGRLSGHSHKTKSHIYSEVHSQA